MHLRSLSPPKITYKLDIIQIINDTMNMILFVFFIIILSVYYAMKYISINNDILIIIFIATLFMISIYCFHLLYLNYPEIFQGINSFLY